MNKRKLLTASPARMIFRLPGLAGLLLLALLPSAQAQAKDLPNIILILADDMGQDALEKTGEADNTLVIFTADNGTASACDFKAHLDKGIDFRSRLRAAKGSIYEGGHRVPLVLRWPKVIEAGSRNGEVVCLNDLFATFAEMTGRPLKAKEGVDSTSLWPLITHQRKRLPDRAMVVNHSYKGQYAIRDKEWKLVLPMKQGGKYELYNLKQDLKETKNLAGQHPERVEKMTATLRSYVENGRSTPGEPQQNHGGRNSWQGLPW